MMQESFVPVELAAKYPTYSLQMTINPHENHSDVRYIF